MNIDDADDGNKEPRENFEDVENKVLDIELFNRGEIEDIDLFTNNGREEEISFIAT